MVTEISGVAVDPSIGGHGAPLSHALPSPENGWPLRPFQIVSLYDVLEFKILILHKHLNAIKDYVRQCANTEPHLQNISEDMRKKLLDEVEDTGKLCLDTLEIERLRRHFDSLKSRLEIKLPEGHTRSYGTMAHELRFLSQEIEHELQQRLFLCVPADRVEFYNQPAYFGVDVNAAFTSAERHIREAGNCYTCGLYTACVYHLTRALEIGLFVLAQDTTLFGLTNPPIAIGVTDAALETWETLIKKVESAITNIQKSPGASHKRRDLDFYSGAAMHFRYFKDHWRNPIAHSRANYDEPQARSAIGRVSEFMKYLTRDLNLKQKPSMVLP